jgi:hypothetical protein
MESWGRLDAVLFEIVGWLPREVHGPGKHGTVEE